MDEPTTHLDIPSIDALIAALQQFEGTLIFISHDVYFIRALANHVLHVNAGRLTPYCGDYLYYLDKTAAASGREGLTAGARNGPVKVDFEDRRSVKLKDQKRVEAEGRQARSKERKQQQQLVHRLEKEIAAFETKQAELTAELEKPETYQQTGRAMEINRELTSVTEALARTTAEWEAAATKLNSLEAA